jgi:hypothetical protein
VPGVLPARCNTFANCGNDVLAVQTRYRVESLTLHKAKDILPQSDSLANEGSGKNGDANYFS